MERPRGAASSALAGSRRWSDCSTRARAVFAERGYHAARVDDIVKAAKTSHGTFYLYFASKQDLFAAIAEGVAAEMVDLARELPSLDGAGAGSADGFRDWLDALRTSSTGDTATSCGRGPTPRSATASSVRSPRTSSPSSPSARDPGAHGRARPRSAHDRVRARLDDRADELLRPVSPAARHAGGGARRDRRSDPGGAPRPAAPRPRLPQRHGRCYVPDAIVSSVQQARWPET